jgi:hypothetical protein
LDNFWIWIEAQVAGSVFWLDQFFGAQDFLSLDISSEMFCAFPHIAQWVA